MTSRLNTTSYRRDTLWRAAMIHRVSGVLLACFLPLHFLALGLLLESEAHFDRFVAFTANPLVKIAELALVFLLAVHLLGGLRILAVEMFTYRPGQKTLALVAVALAAFAALVYALILV